MRWYVTAHGYVLSGPFASREEAMREQRELAVEAARECPNAPMLPTQTRPEIVHEEDPGGHHTWRRVGDWRHRVFLARREDADGSVTYESGVYEGISVVDGTAYSGDSYGQALANAFMQAPEVLAGDV